MKTTFAIFIIFLIVLLFYFIIKRVDNAIENHTKDVVIEIPPNSDTTGEYTIKIISKIIEVNTELDYSKMPSYCKSATYKILHINNYYMVQLSGGTMWSNKYPTVSEAQSEINRAAKDSYDRWINSGGIDY